MGAAVPNFTDRVTMDSPRLTDDGYLVATVRCARTGVQTYDARELGLDDRQGTVAVYRPESAVFAKDSLATYAGKPVTVNHPPAMVTADNWKEYAAGEVGGEIARDGEFVVVPMKLMDAAAIKAVQDGTREISMGYTTPLEVADGVAPDGTPYQAVQTGPIRINHLAIVPQARGGSQLRIGDSAEKWGASPLTDAEHKEGLMPDNLRKIMVDGLQVETTDAGAAAIEKLQKSLADAMTAKEKAEADAKAMEAEKDADIAKKDAAIAKLEGAQLDAAALDARVAARADLIGKAKSVADVDFTGMADADIRKAAVVKALGDAAIEGKSEAYIDARFDILVEAADKADPAQKMKDAPGANLTTLDGVYKERNAALEGAWKQKGAA